MARVDELWIPGSSPRPKLVATDLDGTLLDSRGGVSDRTREVLAALDEMGVPVVFVTGRPIRWMEELWAEVGGHGLAVLSNGGIVYDVARHAVRHALTIPRDVLVTVGDVLREAIPGTTFAVEKTTGYARERDFMPALHVNTDPRLPTGSLTEIADDDVVKLLARHEEIGPDDFWRAVDAEVGSRVTTTSSWVGTLVEMSGHGVTKATTLARLCAELGVEPHEVVAFGDMPNDLPLLEWAGTSFAMENAHPLVIEQAQHRAGHHDRDGVAEALSRIYGI